ncbi:hypothetical protein BU14_0185s0008 [Porphyra umbilicalis]|uniref:Stress-associated endoplasmic reticulum protein n=1 Tax=Porphyra umbilicalis TaxID=2786 RepID=A0A1X6P707_PORUM|nr:hypothetical protein BU14_0185s0008 [Porphyra umbilicalis]|eukprot:OSX76546.1 hypothetical protein BU14_0185s0008 [Porphyra umbilicalis]
MIHLSIPHTYGLSGLLATAAPRHLTTIDPPSSAALVPPVTMVSSQRLKVAEAKFDKNITRKTSTNAKDKVVAKDKGLAVGPVVLGLFVFLILGSSIFELLRAFQK